MELENQTPLAWLPILIAPACDLEVGRDQALPKALHRLLRVCSDAKRPSDQGRPPGPSTGRLTDSLSTCLPGENRRSTARSRRSSSDDNRLSAPLQLRVSSTFGIQAFALTPSAHSSTMNVPRILRNARKVRKKLTHRFNFLSFEATQIQFRMIIGRTTGHFRSMNGFSILM